MSDLRIVHYLLEIQFLGFRFHGWQKQTSDLKTVHGMIDKTLNTVLGHSDFKSKGASRTDAMVSSLSSFCKVTIQGACPAPEELKEKLNFHLPADIKIVRVSVVDEKMRIINDPKEKIYYYLFCNEIKPSPFIAPFMTNFQDRLDLALMDEAAKVFEGTHNFKHYCYQNQNDKIFERTIFESHIKENDFLTANFFPETSYLYMVRGSGFLRHQIRRMMGSLVLVGSGQITLSELKESLKGDSFSNFKSFTAPPSGLMLYKTEFY